MNVGGLEEMYAGSKIEQVHDKRTMIAQKEDDGKEKRGKCLDSRSDLG